MSPDIVMTHDTNLSGHWSEVAREGIRSEENEARSQGFFTGIPMNLISYDAKFCVQVRISARLWILDLRRWEWTLSALMWL